MEDIIAQGAIRRVTIDIANLSGQLAVLQSSMDYLRQVASDLDPESWERLIADDNDGHPAMQITLRGDQVDAVMRMLSAISSLG